MRSDKSSIDQLLMCMSKPQTGDHSGPFPTMKVEPAIIATSDTSRTSYEDNDFMEFGPIKVKPRKRPAPTLATGRRSKYENLPPDEAAKRDVRRKRNREAAERVRLNRLAVEKELQQQIDELEKQNNFLEKNVQNLENEKLQLETRLKTHEQFCSPMNFYPQAEFFITTNLIDSRQNEVDQMNSVGSLDNFDFEPFDLEEIFNGPLANEAIEDFFDNLLQ